MCMYVCITEVEWQEYRELTEASIIRERAERIKRETEQIQKEAHGRFLYIHTLHTNIQNT